MESESKLSCHIMITIDCSSRGVCALTSVSKGQPSLCDFRLFFLGQGKVGCQEGKRGGLLKQIT
jgi:hypothetical protein